MPDKNFKNYYVYLDTETEIFLAQEALKPEEWEKSGFYTINKVNKEVGVRVRTAMKDFLKARGLMDEVDEMSENEAIPLFIMKCSDRAVDALKDFKAASFAYIEPVDDPEEDAAPAAEKPPKPDL